MERVLQQLHIRRVVIKKAIKKAQNEKDQFIEGRLRVSKVKNRTRYFQVINKNDTTGKYLNKTNFDQVKNLAKKDYNRKFLKSAQKELEILDRTIAELSKDNGDLVYQNLKDERKRLVTPYILTDEQFAKEWEDKKYRASVYMPEEKKYETRKGDKVRSKSEAILADILFELGIPYRYEQIITLANGNIKTPDFTLLKKETREEVYLEHLGLLDDETYRNNNLHKLDEYRENGIYCGKNLLITYETEECPLDINGIRKMLEELF